MSTTERADLATKEQYYEIAARITQAMGAVRLLKEDAHNLITRPNFGNLIVDTLMWPSLYAGTSMTQRNLWSAFYKVIFQRDIADESLKNPQRSHANLCQLIVIHIPINYDQISAAYERLGLSLSFVGFDPTMSQLTDEHRRKSAEANTYVITSAVGPSFANCEGDKCRMTLKELLIYRLYFFYTTGLHFSEGAQGTICWGTCSSNNRYPAVTSLDNGYVSVKLLRAEEIRCSGASHRISF